MSLKLLRLVPSLLLALTVVAATSAQEPAKNPQVDLDTSLGKVRVELYQDKAPITVKNFLTYVKAGHYDGTVFHRVIPGFMIQGGGMTADLKEKKGGEPIKNEAGNGLKNLRGTLAMARTSVVDSATAQFFINVKDNDFLNHRDESASGYGYAVFGKVLTGMDVVDKIVNVKTGSRGPFENVPEEPVLIRSARLVAEKPRDEKPKEN
jgi:cyclophilin family peptidyl-prolyl cis-trans isomerase